MEDDRYILMQRYEVGRLLGQGTFAKVYYARNIEDNHSVAIKMIDKEKVLKTGISEQIKREISIMRLVKHPNIVELFEVMASRSKIYFIMEYVKCGELFEKVAKGKLQEDVARKFFQQLISAVDYCHSRSVYHRDLKLENLLLDENDNLKVTDFGLSALAESRSRDGLLHTTCGTPAYVAPEVIGRTGYDGAKADIWSCGVILFVLLAGYLPFHDTNLMEMYRKIGRGEYKYPSWFPPDVRRLLSKILDPNPVTRISISKIRENKWFRKGYDEQKLKEKVGTKDDISVDVASVFSTSESTSGGGRVEEEMEISSLNAFDIISYSAGFDLSGLFTDTDHTREARFTSNKPASAIVAKMHEMAKLLKLKVLKKENGVFKMEAQKDGRKGALAINAEIYEVSPALHFVEIKKSNGDTIEYQRLLNDGIRPALDDIVWAWQDHHHFQQELP